MKRLDVSHIITALVAAVMNRSILLMMNPFGIAYFAGAYMYKPGRWLTALLSVIGMATVMPPGILIKYVGVLLGIVIITRLLELRKKIITPFRMLSLIHI